MPSEKAVRIAKLKDEIRKAKYDHKHADRNLVTKIQMIFRIPLHL